MDVVAQARQSGPGYRLRRRPRAPGGHALDVLSLDSVAGQAILERAGWRVHRVPYRRWLLDRESCLEEIDALLGGTVTSRKNSSSVMVWKSSVH